jgi:palmitoyltransferase
MPPSLPAPLQVLVQSVVPFLVLLVFGYSDYAIGYRLGYKEIFQHHTHGAAITLWVLLGFSQTITFYYWLQVYIKGPGKSPVFPAFDLYANIESLPEYFMCDENGYPYWCTTCQSLKVPRSFHSRRTGYCILKFDHYCIWLGSLLGVSNYIFFFKLAVWFVVMIIIALVFLIVYTKPNRDRGSHSIDGNFIAMYVVGGFWFIMAGGLVVSHIWYVLRGTTTMDDLSVKQQKRYLRWQQAKQAGKAGNRASPRQENGKRYINLRHQDGSRIVVQYSLKDRPYSFSPGRSWIHTFLNGNSYVYNDTLPETNYSVLRLITAIAVSFVPFAELGFKPKTKPLDRTSAAEHYNDYNEAISPSFRKLIESKISAGDFTVAAHYRAFAEAEAKTVSERDTSDTAGDSTSDKVQVQG